MSVSNNSDETVSESSSAGTAVMETQTPEAASATTSSTKNSDNVSTVETRNNIMSHQSVVVQRVPLKQMIINQKQSKQGSLSGIPRGTINLATIEGNITKLDVKQRAPISTATRQTFTYAVPNVASSRKPPVLKCSISPSAIFHWGHPQSAPSVSHLMTPQKVLVAATSSPSPPKSSENNHEPTGNTNHSPMFSLKPSTIFTNPDDTNGRVIDDGKSDPLYNPDGSDTPARPPYSYASLIAQAINSSDSGRMKLNDIYAWIIETYPYYKYQNSGWQNSIRHNLSLNKSFVKVANPSKESGKGSYWQIAEKDQEFFDGNGNFKKRRKSISGIGSAFPNSCSPDNGNPDLDICDDRADSLAGDISNFIQDPIDEYNFDISGVNPNSLNQVTAANNLSRSSIRKGPRKITRKRRIKPGEDEDEDDDPSMYEDDLDRGEGNILASDLNNETGTSNYTDENHSGAGNQANQYNHQSHNQLLKSRNDDGRVRKRSLNGSAKMTDLKGNNLLVDSGLLCSSGDIVPPNKGRRRGSVGCGNLGIDASKYESINRRRKSVPSVIFESDGSDMLGSFHSIPHMTLPDNPLLAIRERMYYDALVRDGITSFNSMDNGLTMNDVEKQSDNSRDIGTKTQGSFYDQGDVNPSVTTVSPGVATTDGGIEWPSHVQAKSLLVNHRNASEEAICDQKYSTSNLLDNGSIEITKGGPQHYQNVLANANNQHQHIYHFSNAVICDEGYDSLPSTRRSMTPFEVTVIQSPVSGDGRYDEVGKQQTGKRSKVTGDSASSHTMFMASNLLSCPELYDMSWPWMDTNSTLENKASKFSQEKDININSSPIIRSDTVDQGKHPNITIYDQNPGTTVTATTTINTFTTPSPSNANSSTHNPLRRLLSLSPSSLHCSGSSSSSSRNSCHPPDLSSTQPVVIQGPYSDFGSDPDNPNATSKDPNERYSSQSVAHMMKAMHEEIYGSSSPPDLSMFTAANNTSDPSAVALAFLGNSGNVVYDKSLGCSVTSSSASDPQEAIGSGTEDDKTWIHLVDLQKTEAS